MGGPGDFPDIQTGTRFSDTFARQWRDLIGRVELLDRNLKDHVQEFAARKPDRDVSLRRVALVENVAEGDKTITVREVKYRPEGTPVVGEYEWGWRFEAYPEVGTSIEEFSSFLFPEQTEQGEPRPPQLGTPILTARRDTDFWYVDVPVTSEKQVVARGAFQGDLGSRFVMVQEVGPEIDASGQWTGEWITIGPVVRVNVWAPKMTAAHFAPFFWIVPRISAMFTTFLPLTTYRGVPYLKQRPDRAVTQQQGRIRTLDCTIPPPGP